MGGHGGNRTRDSGFADRGITTFLRGPTSLKVHKFYGFKDFTIVACNFADFKDFMALQTFFNFVYFNPIFLAKINRYFKKWNTTNAGFFHYILTKIS